MSVTSIGWRRAQIRRAALARAAAPLALLLASACPRAPAPAPPPAPARAPVERWVDAFAPEGGDGSRARAFRGLGRALEESPRPLRVHLAPGLYRGPFELSGGVSLEGVGAVVLHAEGGDEVVVRARGPVSLSGLTVQGGAVGVELGDPGGELRLGQVELSGQRRAAVRAVGGRVQARGVVFRASVSGTSGLILEAGSMGELSGAAFLGPYRRAIEGREVAGLVLDGCRFEGPVTGLHQLGGRAAVRRSAFSGGRGPALFVARGALEVEGSRIKGHEYALQAGEGARLSVRGFVSVGAERAALALVGARADVEDALLLESGNHGGIQVVGGEVSVRRFWIDRPEAYGVLARGGKLHLLDGVVSRVTDRGGEAGDGVQIREAVARVESVSMVEVAGAGLHAAEGSALAVREVVLERCRQGGVVADTLARVDGASLIVRGSSLAAVVVPGEAYVRLDALSSEQNALGAVWAECGSGAEVELLRLREDGPPRPRSPCVRQARPPAARGE